MHHAGAGSPTRCAGVLEEGDIGPGAAGLVRVEEVVHGGVVLVHGLLDEPKPEHARVEVDVPGASPVMQVTWWIPSSFTTSRQSTQATGSPRVK